MSVSLDKGDARLIVAECRKHGLLRNQAAYVLGTAWHETAATMKPVRETLAKTDAKAKELLTKAWKAGKLSWVKRDYWSGGFFGRGYVQLTHEANYRKAGQKLGVDLIGNPGRAMEPAIAAPILVLGMKDGWFTGKKLSDYITLQNSDFRQARRIVNGMDRADLIAGLAKQYDALLKSAGYGEEAAPAPAKPSPAPQQPEPPKPAPQPTPEPAPGKVVVMPPDNSVQPVKNRFVAWLIDLFMAVFWPNRKEK